jgi:hypothetical protein
LLTSSVNIVVRRPFAVNVHFSYQFTKQLSFEELLRAYWKHRKFNLNIITRFIKHFLALRENCWEKIDWGKQKCDLKARAEWGKENFFLKGLFKRSKGKKLVKFSFPFHYYFHFNPSSPFSLRGERFLSRVVCVERRRRRKEQNVIKHFVSRWTPNGENPLFCLSWRFPCWALILWSCAQKFELELITHEQLRSNNKLHLNWDWISIHRWEGNFPYTKKNCSVTKFPL